ncbi:MAG: ABC transporter permease subunit [Ignisphaera sp.]|nr:ABC transporter permease subunit [Ignisphaera sp.]MDW8085631.1 ABC transporter permease subunit [Ignisphaera sp.]
MDRNSVKNSIKIFLMLIPSLTILLSVYLYPFILAILISVVDSSGRLTLEHYSYVFTVYAQDVVFTIAVCALSALVSLLISISIASYIRLSLDEGFRKILNWIFRFPLFIPMVVVAQMMRTFLAPHGFLNTLLAQIGFIELQEAPNLFDWRGLLIGFVWKQTPFMALIILSGFAMVSDVHIDAARVLGAGRLYIVRRILLPMARGSIAIAFALTFASNIGTFTLPYMIIGGAKPTTMTVIMAHRVTYFGDWSIANALGVISYAVVGLFSIAYLREAVRAGVYERERV